MAATVITFKHASHIVKFDGSNFPSWKFGIKMFLEKHRFIPIVDGSEPKPEEVCTAFSTF